MKRLAIFMIFILLLSGCASKDIPPEDTDNENIVEIESLVVDEEKLEEKEEEVPYAPVAVMIENSTAARPQSGLQDADVVYEVYVEGGITRFLAIFNSNYPEVAGPVRSVRHYYLDIAQEWDAYLVHYGGSPLAKAQFDKVPIKRIDGMIDTHRFWRDSSRKSPHNAYIDITKCRDLIDFEQNRRQIKFSEAPQAIGQTCSTVAIPYTSKSYKVEYKYDDESGKNMRFTAGDPFIDRESGEQISVDNIVIQYARHERTENGVGYKEIELYGSGRAQYFIGGQFFEGSWERSDAQSPTKFLDEKGQEIEFLPGNIWIHIVPTNMSVTAE